MKTRAQLCAGFFVLGRVCFFDFRIPDNEVDVLKYFFLLFDGQALNLFHTLDCFFIEHHYVRAHELAQDLGKRGGKAGVLCLLSYGAIDRSQTEHNQFAKSFDACTYVLLAQGTEPTRVNEKMRALVSKFRFFV